MSKKVFLEDYVFGYADAETEFKIKKEIFEKAFYDPKNIVDKLINDYQFILIGRKGVGKTAFSAKIRSISDTPNGNNAITFDEFVELASKRCARILKEVLKDITKEEKEKEKDI